MSLRNPIKIRSQRQACECNIEIPIDVRASGKLAINHYLRLLLCGYRPRYQPMICPHCRTPFELRIEKE